jgi:hypothetical protein
MAKDKKKPFTHNVYIWKSYGRANKQGQRPGWWQLEGRARIEEDGEIYQYLHSTPIGGFDGRIRVIEFSKPQPPQPDWDDIATAHSQEESAPQRPGQTDGE